MGVTQVRLSEEKSDQPKTSQQLLMPENKVVVEQ